MPNTTNFNFPTPADTDLVKDGALAIRNLGNSIDTAFVDLKGGTTGQVLSKNSNTDLDYAWVAQDDSNAIQNAIVDAKGDLISATAADTPAILAVGANDTVLTADSSTATGLKWAAPGGAGANWTLLNSGGTSLSGSTTTISGISGKDKIMVLVYEASSNDYGIIGVRLNTDTGNNYFRYGQQWAVSSTFASSNVQGVGGSASRITIAETYDNGQTSGGVLLTGCNASGVKVFQSSGSGSGTAPFYNFMWNGYYNSSSVISSISVNCSGGSFDGGTVYVYTSA
jgi:hypothetical protein